MQPRSCLNGRVGTAFGSKHWLALDLCGLSCVTFSATFHLFALHTVSHHLISYSTAAQIIFCIFYVPSSLMALTSLGMAWSSDPGAVPIGARPLALLDDDDESPASCTIIDGLETETEGISLPLTNNRNNKVRRRRGIRRCPKCGDNYKPPRAHHDSVTGRCIVKMDHFCPWIGNAVGALNHKFFLLFVFYTSTTSLSSLLLLVLRFIRCSYYINDSEDDEEEQTNNNAQFYQQYEDDASGYDGIHKYRGCGGSDGDELSSPAVLALLSLTFIFLIFTCCMLVEQVDAIESNTSKIARMKLRMARGRGPVGAVAPGEENLEELGRVAQDCNEMFGGTSPNVTWHWFVPTKIWFVDQRKMEEVMGFEFREEWSGSIYEEDHSDDDEEDSDDGSDEKRSNDLGRGLRNGIGDNNDNHENLESGGVELGGGLVQMQNQRQQRGAKFDTHDMDTKLNKMV